MRRATGGARSRPSPTSSARTTCRRRSSGSKARRSAAGTSASRTEGQVRLPAGVQCLVDGRALSNDAIQKLQLMTGDRDTAFTGLYERLVESKLAPVSGRAILAAEQYVIATRFNRSQTAYAAALAQAHATV